MTPTEEAEFWTAVASEVVPDDGEAARAHLAAGRAITYLEPNTPPGHVIRRYPDGRRELVRVERDGDTVVRTLPPE